MTVLSTSRIGKQLQYLLLLFPVIAAMNLWAYFRQNISKFWSSTTALYLGLSLLVVVVGVVLIRLRRLKWATILIGIVTCVVLFFNANAISQKKLYSLGFFSLFYVILVTLYVIRLWQYGRLGYMRDVVPWFSDSLISYSGLNATIDLQQKSYEGIIGNIDASGVCLQIKELTLDRANLTALVELSVKHNDDALQLTGLVRGVVERANVIYIEFVNLSADKELLLKEWLDRAYARGRLSGIVWAE